MPTNEYTDIRSIHDFKSLIKYLYFIPIERDLSEEYKKGFQITEIMPTNSVGLYSARDDLAVQWTEKEVRSKIFQFAKMSPEGARKEFELGPDSEEWKVSLAQQDIKESKFAETKIAPITYRPFDYRFTYYTG